MDSNDITIMRRAAAEAAVRGTPQDHIVLLLNGVASIVAPGPMPRNAVWVAIDELL